LEKRSILAMPESAVDQTCRDRVTQLEADVKDLQKNYAPMLVMEQRFNRLEAGIAQGNATIAQLAEQFKAANSETSRKLEVVFELDAKRMQQIAEHQQELQNERVEAIRAESAEKIALFRMQADKLAEENKILEEKGKLINKMKNWKFVVGFLTAVAVFLGLLFKGILLIVEYGVKHAR
jgi:hypothetical protein